jgi:hypothetical protein
MPNAKGADQGNLTVGIPALQPGNQEFAARNTGSAIVRWRYRLS